MTVNIWFVRGGQHPTSGGPAHVLALSTCVEKLGLKESQWIEGFDETPRLPVLSALENFTLRHVICEIDANSSGWKPGFYRLDLSPQDVIDRLT